jgi:flagellar protein FlaG
MEKILNSPSIASRPIEITQPKEKTEQKLMVDEQLRKPQLELTKEKVESFIQNMNTIISKSNTHLKFEFHDELKEYYVTIVNDSTNEIVKEIPSKKLMDMYASMNEFLGIILDKKI